MREKQEFDPSADPGGQRRPACGIVCKVVAAIHVVMFIGVGLAAWAKWS